jgi:hypothetical protein
MEEFKAEAHVIFEDYKTRIPIKHDDLYEKTQRFIYIQRLVQDFDERLRLCVDGYCQTFSEEENNEADEFIKMKVDEFIVSI